MLLWLRLGPLPDGLLDEPQPSTIVVDRRGVQLYEARSGDGTRSGDAHGGILAANPGRCDHCR